LPHEAIVGEVEGEFEHALRGGGFPVDFLGHGDGFVFQVGVVGNNVDGAHAVHGFGVVGAAEEEDFSGKFLTNHFGQVGGAVAGVEGSHIGVGLFKAGFLSGGDGEVAHHVEGMPAAGRPTVYDGDDDFRHGADESLDFKNVESAAFGFGAGFVNGVGGVPVGVTVAGAAADALVAAGAEGPAAVFRAGSVAGEENAAHVGGLAGVVENRVEFVDGMGAECVADFGPVEGNADNTISPVGADMPVVGDVSEVFEAGNRVPKFGFEGVWGCWCGCWRGSSHSCKA